MATLNLPQNGKARYGSTRQAVPSVDLTAMVDLAFLLITFFMLTTSLSKFNQMEVAKPVESPVPAAYPASRTMTLLLGKNDQIVWYMGEASKAVLRTANFKTIRKLLMQQQKAVLTFHHQDPGKYMIVILKPATGSKYENLVNVLDEMNISGIRSYAIEDTQFFKEETDYLQKQG
eukprot:gene4682-5468_t